MTDTFSKEYRSKIMATVRSRGNKSTELKLISIFRAGKITGWRRNQKFSGNPDFVFRGAKLIIFVDGCFWHGCKKHCRIPSDNRPYWRRKIARNVARDNSTIRHFRKAGWQVVRIWEHSLKNPARIISRIKTGLSSGVDNAKIAKEK